MKCKGVKLSEINSAGLQLKKKGKNKSFFVFVCVWLCVKLPTCPGWTPSVPDDSWDKWARATIVTYSAVKEAVEVDTKQSYTMDIRRFDCWYNMTDGPFQMSLGKFNPSIEHQVLFLI